MRQGAIPESAWRLESPETCAVCGGATSREEHEDLLDIHDPDCLGCPLCEVPVLLFRAQLDGKVLAVALHWNCFVSIQEAQ